MWFQENILRIVAYQWHVTTLALWFSRWTPHCSGKRLCSEIKKKSCKPNCAGQCDMLHNLAHADRLVCACSSCQLVRALWTQVDKFMVLWSYHFAFGKKIETNVSIRFMLSSYMLSFMGPQPSDTSTHLQCVFLILRGLLCLSISSYWMIIMT